MEPDEAHTPGVGGTYGWIDPFADQPKVSPPTFRSASTSARLWAVAIDFLFLKLLAAVTTLAVTGTAMVTVAGGMVDEDSPTPANAALALGTALAVLYFLIWPAVRQGRTLGRRLTGIELRVESDHRGAHRAAHDFVVFVLPSMLLDPIAVIGPRDLLVLGFWFAIQSYRPGSRETAPARVFGLTYVQQQQPPHDGLPPTTA